MLPGGCQSSYIAVTFISAWFTPVHTIPMPSLHCLCIPSRCAENTAHQETSSFVLPAAGLSAMGLYLYGPEAAFANATSKLCKVLDGMVAASSTHAEKLLFISSQSRKFLCKHRAAGTPSSATLPVCEFKLVPSLSGLSIMTCRCTSQMHARCVVLPVLHRGCNLLDNRHKTSCRIA